MLLLFLDSSQLLLAALQHAKLHFSHQLLRHHAAAHCIPPDGFPSRVLINPYSLSSPDAAFEDRNVIRNFVHPQYIDGPGGSPFDIQLLKLTQSSNFQIINLNNETSVPFVGQALKTAGWGLLDGHDEAISDILQALNMTAISNAQCDRGVFDGFITPDMLCADGFNSTGPCNGDSGGPLVVSGEDGEDVQVGIASWVRVRCANREFC